MLNRLIRLNNERLTKIALEWDYDICEYNWCSVILNLLGEINMKKNFITIKSQIVYLFIWGFTSLSTLYRSYHDG